MTREVSPYPFVIFRARARLCALPSTQVRETMRPLPIQALATAPEFVLGAALIRGEAVPVVDAGALLGETEEPRITRFVTLRVGERSIALAVEAVLAVRELPPGAFRQLPPLLDDAESGILSTLGALDAELLTALEPARTLTDSVLHALELSEAAG